MTKLSNLVYYAISGLLYCVDQAGAHYLLINGSHGVYDESGIREKGEAQEATRLRNEKLDALDDYCTDLQTLAEIALEEQPQLMEKLGILVRSDYKDPGFSISVGFPL